MFLRGVGCNWLVCLAVWMSLAAKSVSGKILAIFFPIMAFVAMGFDHVVANMFFLPAAMFAGVPDIGWGDTLLNWLLAGIGNLVGAVVFVATSYWYLFLKDQPEKAVAVVGAGRARLTALHAAPSAARSEGSRGARWVRAALTVAAVVVLLLG